MDKKGIIAIALSIATLVIWQMKFAPKYTPPPAKAAVEKSVAESSASPAAITESSTSPVVAPVEKDPAAAGIAEKIEKVPSPAVNYAFTNLGGGIATASLLEHLAENGTQVTLNDHGTLPIGALGNQPGGGGQDVFNVKTDEQKGEVICERAAPGQLQVTKKFTLPSAKSGPEQYIVTMDVTFKNQGTQPYHSGRYYVSTGAAAPIHHKDLPTYTTFDWYHGTGKATNISVLWFEGGKIPLLGIQTSAPKTSYVADAEGITWAGVRSQYFATSGTPVEKHAQTVWAERQKLVTDDPNKPLYVIEGGIGMPGFDLAPGAAVTQQFKIYAGPKKYQLLQLLGNDEVKIMHEYGMFGVVSKFLLRSMNWLHGVFGNYAAAIIVLTLIIKTAMWPLQNASTKSMKKMQALQPRMKELQEKYKADPTRMNQETMKLYKEHGVNPLSGCLPMFVQIPIFFGFYSMLGTAIELRNSRFLWVKDLSQPDTLFQMSGFNVNLLPLLMAGTMLWQMSLTPKSGDQTQQKVMMFVPLIFISFCYNFASALALYWTVQNIFSIVQLYVTRNKTAPVLQKIVPRRKR